MNCWLCGTINDCNCPTEREYIEEQRLAEQRRNQKAHEASVARQKKRIKIAPWRDPNHPEYRG